MADIKVKTGKLSYIFCRVDGVDVSQIVLATPTISEALFTIDRPLVVKIIESRAHGKRFNPSILLLQVCPHHGFPEFLSCR